MKLLVIFFSIQICSVQSHVNHGKVYIDFSLGCINFPYDMTSKFLYVKIEANN